MFKSMTQNVKVYLATLSIIWAIVIAADLIWGKADAELHVMFGLIFLLLLFGGKHWSRRAKKA